MARRYAPFLLLAATQLMLVALVPSTGDRPAEVLAGGPGQYGGDYNADLGEAGGGESDPSAPGATVAAQGSKRTAAGQAGGRGAGGPAAHGPTTGGGEDKTAGVTSVAGEDRSKCAPDGVRQQDVTLSSPPCVPRFTGDNGGATYQGVTRTSVRVLRYRPKSNAQVDAILRTQGLASSPEEEEHAAAAFAKFFEKRYELHGRKIEWITVQGTCEISPPDLACFRDEVRRLNNQYKPFMVFWTNSTTQAEFFEQWSQLGVINLGGWHFNADFNLSLRPYHYDLFMDGTRTARNIADYWCKKMRGKPASLAGDPQLRVQTRKLGILTQDFPVTRKNALDLQRMVSGEVCGRPEDVADPVYTPSDIQRAQQTANTAVQKLKDDGVTTLVIMSDPINPTFTTTAATGQRWFPEHLLAGSGLIDYDVLGRLYDQSQWVNAFGPGHLADPIPFEQSDAAKAAADVGVTGIYSGANLLYAYMALAATQLQMGGPFLTPANVERETLSLPPSGGWERTGNPASILLKFGANDYTLIEDSRHTYWSPNAVSKIDGKAGAYVALERGRRWEIGTWPAGEPKQ